MTYVKIRLRKRLPVLTGITLAGVLCLVLAAFAADWASPHLDKTKNPGGCGSCHRGHGKRGTQMLATVTSDICFTCHGRTSSVNAIIAKNDMASVFNKLYKHPVIETGKYHRSSEELPDKGTGAQRHVACQDCHKVHDLTSAKPLAGVRGFTQTQTRAKFAEARNEYEVCYKCHADSLDLPLGSKNKRFEFDRNNLSYHPVEAAGRNRRVPSLINPLNVMSTIKCSDCHGNDDPFGPKGPHGSNYPAMLKFEYIRNEAAEASRTYELCYACHDRQNILDNQSFRKHKEHIVFNHIPCSACHTPHGTDRNPHLIEFDQKFAGFIPMPVYMPSLDGRPMCLLKCHVGGRDIEHNNAFYLGKRWP